MNKQMLESIFWLIIIALSYALFFVNTELALWVIIIILNGYIVRNLFFYWKKIKKVAVPGAQKIPIEIFDEKIDMKHLSELLDNSIQKWGSINAYNLWIEESAELTKELVKFFYRNKNTIENIREEIIDVYIMLINLIRIFGFDEKIYSVKIERLDRLLKEF